MLDCSDLILSHCHRSEEDDFIEEIYLSYPDGHSKHILANN